MNILPRDKQIEVIAALCDGLGVRAASRITGVNRGTVAALAMRVGKGAAELHDRIMVGLRVSRIECDELWAYVAKKQRNVRRDENPFAVGDQYTYIALASSSKAIIGYRTGKRQGPTTDEFIQDLRERVIGSPEFSTDGFHPYKAAIRDAFGGSAHGTITKTMSVTDLRKDAAHRYSPAAVVAVSREAVMGVPMEISTSYVERQNLTVRMGIRRFTRLTNGFSKRLENHLAAVALYVAHYNLCRSHEALKTAPAVALGITDRVWTVGDLLDAALATQPINPVMTAPDRRKSFRVIEGGKE